MQLRGTRACDSLLVSSISHSIMLPVKQAPGSIEAYVQEETDNGYPPDNGWLDE